jgi:hypothetical protein
MKTINDLFALIFEAIALETNNNFAIKRDVNYSFNQESGMLSFDITYRHEEIRRKDVNFLFKLENMTEVQIQSHYWHLESHLARHRG